MLYTSLLALAAPNWGGFFVWSWLRMNPVQASNFVCERHLGLGSGGCTVYLINGTGREVFRIMGPLTGLASVARF